MWAYKLLSLVCTKVVVAAREAVNVIHLTNTYKYSIYFQSKKAGQIESTI